MLVALAACAAALGLGAAPASAGSPAANIGTAGGAPGAGTDVTGAPEALVPGATSAERALADKYAPVVMLVHQDALCERGEPYKPSDVDALFDNPEVALRGPWDRDDLIKVGPTADDLGAGLDGYHIDLPGNPLKPGCGYEKWAAATFAATPPTVYAHVAKQADVADKVALQYWFYYPFNDYNNKHESDWEMVQIVFPAADASQALTVDPLDVAYSQHEGSETADWGDDKLDIEDGTHPVVYVAAGSHANFYDSALYLGRSAQQGFGCDNTLGPVDAVNPVVQVVPGNTAAAQAAFPWIGYEGRWGQREAAFYNAPTGPNMKESWSQPITAQEERAHDRAFAVPLGGLFGTVATDFFCSGVAGGSDLLRSVVDHPGPPLLVLAVVVLLLVLLVRHTRWRPVAPLRLARRRDGGQALAGAARLYVTRPVLFLGIGLLTVPAALVSWAVEDFLVHGALGGIDESGQAGGYRAFVAGVLGFGLLGFAVVCVLAATTRAMAALDGDRRPTIVTAYREALARWRPLLGAFLVSAVLIVILGLSVILSIVALALMLLFSLFVPAIVLEGATALRGLRRSVELVRHEPMKVAVLLAASVLVVAALGPVLGTALLFGTGAPFIVANAVAGVAFAVLVPYVGMTMTYVYFDARVHEERADAAPAVLPAEIPFPPSPG